MSSPEEVANLNLSQENIRDTILRNVLSATKRTCPKSRRINISPLPLADIAKEFEEAEKEARSFIKTIVEDDETEEVSNSCTSVVQDDLVKSNSFNSIGTTKDNTFPLQSIENNIVQPDNREGTIKTNSSNTLKTNSIPIRCNNNIKITSSNVNNSFELNFSALPLQTPVKNKNDLIDPKPGLLKQIDRVNRPLAPQFSALSTQTPVQKPCFATSTVKTTNSLPPPAKVNKHLLPQLSSKTDKSHWITPKYRPINKSSDNVQRPPPDHGSATPKIQFTTTIRNTPIYRVSRSSSVGQETEIKNSDLKPLVGPIDTTFRRISVNGVEYIILNELGKGGSSEVFQCFNPETKVLRAIKCVSLENPASAEGFIKEVEVLKRLQTCDRIVKMFDFEIKRSEETLLVVLEVGGADLAKILKSSITNMPKYMMIYYWMEMLLAVRQIHQNGIIHSDLKPANFLQAEGCLKLIDFGISSCIQNDMTSVIKPVAEGSLNYISPEALNNENSSIPGSPSYNKTKYKISFKSDVWSLGCILYQLVYKRTPFQHISQMWKKCSTICDPNHTIDYPPVTGVSQRVINTIKSCLQYNMRLRPSMDDLISDYEAVLKNL